MMHWRSAQKIEESAAEFVFSNRGVKPQSVVGHLVREFKDSPATAVSFALTSMASVLEHPAVDFSDDPADFVQELYRAIAVLTSDIFAVEALNQKIVKCQDLLEFWFQTEEIFFS